VVAARSDETPPLPRVQLEFLEFGAGNRMMRNSIGSPFAMLNTMVVVNPIALATENAGTGRIVIDCYFLPAHDNTPSFAGRVRGFVTSGGDSDSAEAAGKLIAKALQIEGGT
jgi:hypothetical protein